MFFIQDKEHLISITHCEKSDAELEGGESAEFLHRNLLCFSRHYLVLFVAASNEENCSMKYVSALQYVKVLLSVMHYIKK